MNDMENEERLFIKLLGERVRGTWRSLGARVLEAMEEQGKVNAL